MGGWAGGAGGLAISVQTRNDLVNRSVERDGIRAEALDPDP